MDIDVNVNERMEKESVTKVVSFSPFHGGCVALWIFLGPNQAKRR